MTRPARPAYRSPRRYRLRRWRGGCLYFGCVMPAAYAALAMWAALDAAARFFRRRP